eukprot:3238068-Ditylum_brightwellii.AAC.1
MKFDNKEVHCIAHKFNLGDTGIDFLFKPMFNSQVYGAVDDIIYIEPNLQRGVVRKDLTMKGPWGHCWSPIYNSIFLDFCTNGKEAI